MRSALHTLGWLACVVYSTIPAFWLLIHTRIDYWRSCRRSPYRVLIPVWIGMWVLVALITLPWRTASLYQNPWTWCPAVALFALGIWMYSRAGVGFSPKQLGGLPEVQAGHPEQRLVIAGIRARVRHPVYLAHLCEMLAWSVGTGLLAGYGLTALAIVTGVIMIRAEDAELLRRFGDDHRIYKRRVPAVIPGRGIDEIRGRLALVEGGVQYEVSGRGGWHLDMADIVCFAEYTTGVGPWADDYFLVFMSKHAKYCEASFYSDGRDTVIESLCREWRSDLRLQLVGSTKFASRVIWPPRVEGKPLFIGCGTSKVNPQVEELASSRGASQQCWIR